MTFDGKVAAGTPMRLVQNISPSIRISYDALCELATNSQDNTFLCGIRDLSDANTGAKITVELRLYKLDQSGNPTTEYVVVSVQQFEIQ
jgi:hypothetical protein